MFLSVRIFFLLFAIILAAGLNAQQKPVDTASVDKPNASEVHIQPTIKFGVVLQIVGDLQYENSDNVPNGFQVANMRLSARGRADRYFSYLATASIANAPSILDARITYHYRPSLEFDAGLMKVPFSYEFLVPAQSIDFVNRSAIVSLAAPNRSIGVQARGSLPRGINYAAGVFNGNRFGGNQNDSGKFLYAARISVDRSDSANRHLNFGLNAAYSDDKSATFVTPGFDGTRLLYGADVRANYYSLLISTEAILFRLDPDPGSSLTGWGLQHTLGHSIDAKNQILARFDYVKSSDLNLEYKALIFGYNLWPTPYSEIQANYIVDLDNAKPKNHQLLLNLQVAF